MTEMNLPPTGVYCLDHNPYSEQIDADRYLSSLLDLAYEKTNGQLWNGVNKVLNLRDVPHNLFPSGTSMRFISELGESSEKTGKLLMTKSLQNNKIAIIIKVRTSFDKGKHTGSAFEVSSAGIAPDEVLNFFLSYYFMSVSK